MTLDDIYPTFDPQPWADRAACRGVDTALFFPEKGSSVASDQAKAVCATCPVKTECLDYAIRNTIRHGIWGGLTEHERRPLRRQMREAS